MLASFSKLSAIPYAQIVVLAVAAMIFSPAVLPSSQSWGYESVSLALGFGAFCTAFTWIELRKHAALGAPVLLIQVPRTN